jgi:flagellar L-ring protein precursor FlgH
MGMRIFKYMMISMLVVLVLGISGVQAESLWVDNSATSGLFGDRKARAVGDILTILVSETSSASRTGNAANSKSASGSASAGTGIFKFIGAASLGTSDQFQAKGSISNTNNVTAKLTVTVVEVKPNGNLVVAGTQSIKQNGEEQKINISGVVRVEDISPDNTVLSSYVADAQIRIEGNGPIANKQRQGILTQIWNFLF